LNRTESEYYIPVSVADPDPGSGAFLTPGSVIRDPEWVFSGSRISDPGSKDRILKGLLTIFQKIWIRDKHPGSATLIPVSGIKK